ncbi:uncharacterized protein LOC144173494 [Haemaphysalis longicornis]
MHPKPSSSRQASRTRVSRRQQGLQPEFGLLPDKVKKKEIVTTTMINGGTMTNATNPALVLQQPREPPSFHKSPSEDPEDWLEQVERVRLFNRWEDAETPRQLFFYLEDSARIWFENNEASLESWNDFRTQFLATFTTVVRKERAEVLLQTLTQHRNEGIVVFVEEMKRLFRHADPCMAEEKKLRFLMRGVKELFAGLVRNPPKTVAEFVTEASTIEKALEMRAKQYDRNFVGTANVNYVDSMRIPADSLRETIRAVVREELRKLLPTPPQPQAASLTEVIREETHHAPDPASAHLRSKNTCPTPAMDQPVSTVVVRMGAIAPHGD